jgi:hypothetical protein
MPPMSMAMIEAVGDRTLELLCPDALARPVAIDFLRLVEWVLPKYGIFTYPANWEELGDRLGATDPSGDREIYILLCEELWDQLIAGGRQANRARATVAHELAHAILHVPYLRRRMATAQGALLNRVSRDSIRPFEDPEWQAWALAGCLVAPPKAISMLQDVSVSAVAATFGVSEGMAQAHLKRLKLHAGGLE